MSAIEHLTIAVPVELADRMRHRVAAGEFADLDEIVQAALGVFDLEIAEHEADFDDWFRRFIVPVVEINRCDPSRLMTGDQVLSSLAARRAVRDAAA